MVLGSGLSGVSSRSSPVPISPTHVSMYSIALVNKTTVASLCTDSYFFNCRGRVIE